MCIFERPDDRSVAPRRFSVLVVEDHEATREAVMSLLAGSVANVEVMAVDSAERALPICETAPPDIVIMDISLPGMNGIEATQQIRQSFPATRVVIHSNSEAQVLREGSMAAGACAFVAKGRTSNELAAIVSGLLYGSR
jgi:DNA-binding NarL/FixJ family response regulator